MMNGDDDLLARELGWIDPEPETDQRWFKTRPPGVHVMNGISGLMVLGSIAANLAWLGPVSTENGLGRLIGFIFEIAVCAVVAIFLSKLIWRVIGPGLRSMLRPLGILGPMPVAFVLLVGALVVWKLPEMRNEQARAEAAEAFDGIEFAPLLDAQGHLEKRSLAEALDTCTTRGEGWRLPRRGDEAFLKARLARRVFKHEAFYSAAADADPKGTAMFIYDSRGAKFERSIAVPSRPVGVVCIKPP